MFFFLKSLSRSVHEEHHLHEPDHHQSKSKEEGMCTSLTVWRKSLVISCSGFTVINSDGDLVYRVDNYMGRPQELTLMDGSGKPILTMSRRKKLGVLVDSWLIYEGEVGRNGYCTRTKASKKPIWCVKKHVNILQANHQVLARVFRGSSSSSDKRHSFVVEGSYSHRSCKVLDESRRVVAEIKRKEAMIGGISFGLEVFVLTVQPGFDHGFAMSLVLVLDQMFS
ncbi:hypothetical protein Tsubulata_037356 [Turnera subulata]|uniref:Protein LURP-one-related 17 n=1 Tax=Turnera subulata TaxID=218843 RepID=A0A9Q0J3E4_9ROSI|nr:hypothetical protein Tsubulata_037356 [Turnera subulata]